MIWDWEIFLGVMLLTLGLVLLIVGILTTYFGAGKSRKIGVGLLVGGIVIACGYGYYAYNGSIELIDSIIMPTLFYVVAVIIGLAIGIGLFLLAIMKS